MKPNDTQSPDWIPWAPFLRLVRWLSCLVAAAAFAQVPTTFTYQGYLTGGDGMALGIQAPRAYDVVFRVFSSESGGAQVWAEQQTVSVDKGYFSVQLGAGTPVAGFTNSSAGFRSVFSGAGAAERYVSLAIKGIGSGGSDFVVEPRVRLLSAPYAYLAQAAASILDSSGGTAIGQVGSGVVFNRSLSAATLSAASGSAGSMTVSNKITFMASGTSSGGGAGFVKVSQGDVRVIAGRHRWTNGLTTFLTEPSPGYSVTRISVGNYRIDFDQPFNGVPAVVATATPLTAGNAYSPAADGVNLVHASWFPGPTVFVSQSTDPAIARSSVNLVLKRKFMYRADQTTWVHFVWGIGISGMLQNDFNALWTQPIWSTLDYEADCDFQFYAAGP